MENYSYVIGIVSYLGALWVLVVYGLISRLDDDRIFQAYSVTFLSLLGGFFLVWGGFSGDSLQLSNYFYWYLDKFPDVNDYFLYKAPFFLFGSLLDKVFHPPWPIKLVQVLVVALIGWGIFRFFSRSEGRARLLALAILLINPAFFFLAGNVVRQGIAAGLFLLTLTLFLNRKYVGYATLAVLAIAIHPSALIPVLATLVAKTIPVRFLRVLLLIAPAMSFFCIWFLQDTWLVEKLIYRDNSEGALHYEKFVIIYLLAWLVLLNLARLPSEKIQFVARVFLLTTILSSGFLYFEIPFERFSLYAQLTLVLVLPSLVEIFEQRYLSSNYLRKSAYCLSAIPGLLLWTHPAILVSLGYLR